MSVASLFARAIDALLKLICFAIAVPIVLVLGAFVLARQFLDWVDLHAHFDGDREAQLKSHWGKQ